MLTIMMIWDTWLLGDHPGPIWWFPKIGVCGYIHFSIVHSKPSIWVPPGTPILGNLHMEKMFDIFCPLDPRVQAIIRLLGGQAYGAQARTGQWNLDKVIPVHEAPFLIKHTTMEHHHSFDIAVTSSTKWGTFHRWNGADGPCSPHLCVGFLFLVLYPAVRLLPSSSLAHT